ncbi:MULTISPECIES: hypothetical protein [unclassified Shinella]|jgi:hypothetical protein|uniref:hypothetical protein n=1 Tax=unclassified Shinella TaxID=2643062 RepID=UPI0018CC060E|nr:MULTISPECIES: hypothetical protein [unclassified Shinella]MCO5149097.1 hypothetical protein [Shinella sp.]MDC7265155.1 hypothetical protein [Shinella sp. HY16]MDC7272052.1 hypothetical protein [Shinella sp. YZ44]
MILIILSNLASAIERYLAFVRRCGDYSLHRFDASLVARVRRDFGLADPSLPPTATEAQHAALRPGNGTPRRRGLPVRVHRAGGGA